MKAAVFADTGVLAVQERKAPHLASDDDVLVRVLACGICGTDVHILSDPPGHPANKGVVLGHEFVGEIAEAGPAVQSVAAGDRVAVRPILTCGTCRPCLAGLPNHCERMDALGVYRDGGLAGEVVAPASACIPISTSVPVHLAALTEPLACVLNAVKRAQPAPGDEVVVFGAGAIGLLFLAVLRSAGAARVVVVEPASARRTVAHSMGADAALDPTEADVEALVAAHVPHGPGVVIDAVGSQLATAVQIAAPAARVVLFGMNTHARPEVPQVAITEKELTVLGSYVGQHRFPEAARLLESGALDVEPIVSHVVGLERVPEVVEELRRGAAIKAVVKLAEA